MQPSDIQSLSAEREQRETRFARMCKALGHPVRVRIVRHLLESSTCQCGEIVSLFPLAQSTVSQHLKLLKQAGLICGTVDGPSTCYCLDPGALKLLSQEFSTLFDVQTSEKQSHGA